MKKCPQCGFKNQLDSQFCKQCGVKLNSDQDEKSPLTREAAREVQNKRKRKIIYFVIAIILILIILLFVLTQVTGGHRSKSSSNVDESSTLTGNKKSVKKQSSSSLMISSLSQSTVTHSASHASIRTMPNVDTKNLTTQQVNKWVYANIMTDWNKNNSDEPPLTATDQNAFIFNQSTDDQGCVEIQVQENHQSAFMKSIHADPESTPTIGWYRINAEGYLQEGNPGSNNWKTIAQSYQEP